MTKAGAPCATDCPSVIRTAVTTPLRVDRIGSAPRPGISTKGLEMVSGSVMTIDAMSAAAKTTMTIIERPRAAQCGGSVSRNGSAASDPGERGSSAMALRAPAAG